MMRNNILFMATLVLWLGLSCTASPQEVYRKANKAIPNIHGGYDYYDESDKKTGYSVANRSGGYDYYDTRGNFEGSLKKDTEAGQYHYYDKKSVKQGIVSKTASERYSYKYRSRDKGAYKVEPLGQRGDVGEISSQELGRAVKK